MNKIKRLLLPVCLALLTNILVAGNPSWSDVFYQGWVKSKKGGGFSYHSPDPAAGTSLLVRSADSLQYIEWETEAVPAEISSDDITFVWMFGIDATPSGHIFRLYLNGDYCLSFANPVLPDKSPLTINGNNGTSITFRTTMIDKYNDLMGYAFLKIPKNLINKGKPQIIKVSGESADSRVWYMTFEGGVKRSIKLFQQEALIRGENGNNKFCVVAEIVHLGDPGKIIFSKAGEKTDTFKIEPGYNRFRLYFPEGNQERKETVGIEMPGSEKNQQEVVLKPVKKWQIYLVQHTHTDIGYTRPQSEILPEHLRYIDYALDYCDLTDSLPDKAKFRWTCETSWAVDQYLKTRPAKQIERLKKRVAEGRIEVTGLYLNSSDLADEATIAASLQPIKTFRENGIPVRAAMQSDINGVPWCLVDYFNSAGIEFLNMAQNTDRARKPFDRPTTFLWESQSGNRVIVNRPEHYMLGNTLGVINSIESLEKNLFTHLGEISSKGYPFDEYAIQFSGYFTDNSPPSTAACSIVEEWNKTYIWPSLRLATISEFPDVISKNHLNELQVVKGAWPDWWIDGFGSAAVPTAYARLSHSDYIANNELMSMAAFLGCPGSSRIKDLQRQVTDDLAFYDEHTFGAAESITDPLCENSIVQLGEKLSYSWEAYKKNHIVREEILGNIQDHLPSFAQKSSISVINTINFTRSGNVSIYADHQVLPNDRQFRILDKENNIIRIQESNSRSEGSYWTIYAPDVPAMGYTSFRIEKSDIPLQTVPVPQFDGLLENQWYRIKCDKESGRILSISDKETGREITDSTAEYGFGELVYETLGRNREQVTSGRLQDFKRKTWEDLKIVTTTDGPVWKGITISAELPGCAAEGETKCEIRLYKQEKKIEFRYSMRKNKVTDPEGLYVSFPFKMKDEAKVDFEVAGATVEAGKEQIPGSSADWQGIQNFVYVSDKETGIIFVSPEIPIVQLGGLNLGKFAAVPPKPSPVIYSWVLNNYWTTNFLASQEGELKWTYQITSGPHVTNDKISGFAWSQRIPLLSRVIPPTGIERKIPAKAGFMKPMPENILLINSLPCDNNKGIIFQLRETAGQSVIFDPVYLLGMSSKKNKLTIITSLVNILGEEIESAGQKITIGPFQTVFVKSVWYD